jgi:hypothetical protein
MVESPGFGGGTHTRARCFLRIRPRTGSNCVLPAMKHRAWPMNDAPIKWGKIMAGMEILASMDILDAGSLIADLSHSQSAARAAS